ncbi:FAD-binding oxidoreductase [Catelliglobosispora koreensis]|uniref:FAD-binding oxidoreductase n=1 Tax=Catelliglobosispora koreensis TaxID=129052 RepID=UPI00035E7B9A|nr:FAD-binding oxidoreductase [Catelliglobosispora koreensis]
MHAPNLARIAASASRRAPSPAAAAALATALTAALGPGRVSTSESARRAASTDYSHMSPLLPGVLPQRTADIVVRPRDNSELTEAMRLAHAHETPIVARGRGTGNYGQAVPLAAGLVLDLTALDAITETGTGWMHAQAGATFVALEAAARQTGQEILMMPTTIGSTIGGFLAGGAGGIGSIEHGWLWNGFVIALDVVACPPGTAPLALRGQQCLPYLHAYGVTGVIAAATIKLAPARERKAILASFPAEAGDAAVQAGLSLMRQDPPPRLVSIDEPGIVATYPADGAMPPGRHSLRAIVDASTLDTVLAVITGHGGWVESTPEDAESYLSTLAFNHVTLRARKARPELCHLQVGGPALVTHAAQIRDALPGALLHLDGGPGGQFAGLLLSEFRDADTLYKGITRLEELGVHVVDPHTWLLGGPALDGIRATAAVNDAHGLLNPGRFPA